MDRQPIILPEDYYGFKHNIFDLVVSNPPYVVSRSIVGGLEYEPRIALEATNNGLYFIEKILQQAHLYLQRGGYLVIEMGYNHKDGVDSILYDMGSYEIVKWIKDYSNNWRGVVLKSKTKYQKPKTKSKNL